MSATSTSRFRRGRPSFSRQAWLLLLAGLPLFTLSVLFIHAYQVVNGMLMSTTFILVYVSTLRVKNAGIRFTRATLIGFIACLVTIGSLTENPALWASQVHRKAFKSTALIQPGSPAIAGLHDALYWWLDNVSSNVNNWISFYGEGLNDTSKPMDDEYFNSSFRSIPHASISAWEFANGTTLDEIDKIMIVDRFIRSHVMIWTSDSETWNVTDHVPDPAEALAGWSFSEAWKQDTANPALQARDDCDGITVVTVSLLRRLRDHGALSSIAYIASGRRHWFTAVIIDATPVLFLYHWREIGVYGVFMDDGSIMSGQNLARTFLEVSITSEEHRDEMLFYLGFLVEGMPWLIPVAAVVLAMLAVVLLGYPRDYEIDSERARVATAMERHRGKPRVVQALAWLFAVKVGNPFARRHWLFWLNVATTASLLVAGVFMLYHAILLTTTFTYATMFIFGALLATLLVLDRDIPGRVFSWLYHLITRKKFTAYPAGT